MRGAGAVRITIDTELLPSDAPDADVIALDEALKALGEVDPRKGQVVERRFFGGLSVEETAAVLGVSSDTVSRDWKFAKTWLYRELRETASGKR
jgi:RNA polymerase sigma-70 factor, ECF subfamily